MLKHPKKHHVALFSLCSVALLALCATVVGVGTLKVAVLMDRMSDDGDKAELLFVQTATSASITQNADNTFTLALKDMPEQMHWFTDRPERQSHSFNTADFVADWDDYSFNSDAPNAALEFEDSNGYNRTLAVELTNPSWDDAASNTTYTIQALEGSDPITEMEMGQVSLFIDDASAKVVAGCVMQPNTSCPSVDLSGQDLVEYNLSGSTFYNAKFDYANLSGANLDGATLTGSTFVGTTVTNLTAKGANIDPVNYAVFAPLGYKISDFYYCYGNGRGVDWSGQNLGFEASSYCSTDFTGANLSNTTATNVNFNGTIFANANLTGVQLDEGLFYNAVFDGANVTNAQFEGGVMTGSSFNSVDFTKAQSCSGTTGAPTGCPQ